MIRVFIGYDPRESVAYHACVQSIIDNTSVPVSITPLHIPMLEGFDGQRDGTNAFIYSRYLVPALCEFKGWALFIDGDMLVRGDLADLWALRDSAYAVQLVRHEYVTQHPRKYRGSPMEDANINYPRKNWSSVVLWNCTHPSHAVLEKSFVEDVGGVFLHRFMWLEDDEIGGLPPEWNVLVGEGHVGDAKITHYTLGIPGFQHYRQEQYACEWAGTYLRAINLIGENPLALTNWASEATCG